MENEFLILMVKAGRNIKDINKKILKERGYYLKEAQGPVEAEKFLMYRVPDLLVLDGRTPKEKRNKILERYRRLGGRPVIFLEGDEDEKEELWDYYLETPHLFDEFLEVVERLLVREFQAKKMKAGKLTLDLVLATAFLDGEELYLTKKEFSLLKIFMEHQGEEMSAKEIYELAWGENPKKGAANVRKHVMNLRHKIKAEDSTDYDIFTVYGKGYSFVVSTEDKKVG